jgi:hypothetical protein
MSDSDTSATARDDSQQQVRGRSANGCETTADIGQLFARSHPKLIHWRVASMDLANLRTYADAGFAHDRFVTLLVIC